MRVNSHTIEGDDVGCSKVGRLTKSGRTCSSFEKCYRICVTKIALTSNVTSYRMSFIRPLRVFVERAKPANNKSVFLDLVHM